MPSNLDPYTYPGTDVLRNLADIRDPEALASFEAGQTFARISELDDRPLPGRFDVAHLRAIHKFIFQDVFSWAGDFRTVNISKGGNFFGAAEFIEPALHDFLRRLPGENFLQQLDPQHFACRAGFYLGEINAVHPFREGNGRTQREFIGQLAVTAGYQLDWGRITRDQMISASRTSFKTGNSAGLAGLLSTCLTELQP
jgi:cell filamentation protein